MKGTITNAHYYAEHSCIAVHLDMEDGSKRRAYVYASALLFGGKPADQVPKKDVDREMNKTAELFLKARGKKINVAMDESQARIA